MSKRREIDFDDEDETPKAAAEAAVKRIFDALPPGAFRVWPPDRVVTGDGDGI